MKKKACILNDFSSTGLSGKTARDVMSTRLRPVGMSNIGWSPFIGPRPLSMLPGSLIRATDPGPD